MIFNSHQHRCSPSYSVLNVGLPFFLSIFNSPLCCWIDLSSYVVCESDYDVVDDGEEDGQVDLKSNQVDFLATRCQLLLFRV